MSRTDSESELQTNSRRTDGSHPFRLSAHSLLSEIQPELAPAVPQFTEVGPALLKQFKSIPGDLQAAKGRFQRYSPQTQQRMKDIKDCLNTLVQAEKAYQAAIDRGDTQEVDVQRATMKETLDKVYKEFHQLLLAVSSALGKGTGGSKKRRLEMNDGLMHMQQKIDAQRRLLKLQCPAEQAQQTTQCLMVDGMTKSPSGDLPAERVSLVSEQEKAKLKMELNSIKVKVELREEFAALKGRIKSFETFSYKRSPEIKGSMARFQYLLDKGIDGASPTDSGGDMPSNSEMVIKEFKTLSGLVDDWLIEAEHVDAFSAGKCIFKMNTFLERLEAAAQTR